MATGKQQNLLVPLIISVVVTVATSVTAFLFYQQTTKLNTEKTSAQEAEKKAVAARGTAENYVKVLKQKIGYPDAEFGQENDAPGGGSLMSKIAEDLTKYADTGVPPSFSYKDELFRLAERRDNLTKELAAKDDDLKALKELYDKQRLVETEKINEHDNNFQQAKADLDKTQKDVDQKLAERDRQIQDRQSQTEKLAQEKQQVERQLDTVTTRSEIDINKLATQVREYKDTVDRIQSAGTPVGSVVSVDNLNREVYVDRGEADLLPAQTTMSVWSPDKEGTLYWRLKNEKTKKDAAKEYEASGKRNVLEPRLEGGPKAYIEIVKILGPHEAKGRITMEKLADPIAPGDRLFSPIWTPGHKRHFALAGQFDMTGKGTNDRALLINMIKRQGGIIDAEVRDDGTIEGDVEVSTNYLVVGSMPDESDNTDPLKDFAGRIRTSTTDLRTKASRLGVEIIDQYKLYDFMGYKPQSRKYEPGGYTGAPAATNRFENPTQTTRPKGLPGYETPGVSTRPSGVPGKSNKKNP